MSDFEEKYWWFVGRQRIIISILEKQVGFRSDLKILDVGCGSGGTTLSLTKFGTICGMDYSTSALRYAIQRGLNKVFQGSVYDLPFQNQTFDLITILDSLEHIEDDVRVLRELRRVIKKDGIILIAVPAFQFLWSEHDVALSHFRRYNSNSLSLALDEAGLQKTWSSYAISFLFPAIAAYRILKRKKGYLNPKPTLVELPNFLNSFFQRILLVEEKLILKLGLPFGLSLLCIAKIKS